MEVNTGFEAGADQTPSMAQRFDANTYPLGPGVRLLEASAGTGKTFALAHLCLRLITEADHALEALLVVTFTDAAAEELRSRICLLYTSPSPRDLSTSRMPSSA